MPVPPISIIILHWKGRWLARCLAALQQQTFSDFEVLVVNNSNSAWEVRNPGLNLRLIQPGRNLGFARANNRAVEQSQSRWVVLLNDDAFPEPDWLEHLIKAATQHPQYRFFASRLVQAQHPTLLDGAGDVYHISGLAWRRFYNLPADRYGQQVEEVFGPCAAAAMYDREAFLEVGGFDEAYFAYQEDVDLAFRLRLSGHRCLYVPSAVVHHIGSASTGTQSDFAVYYGHRNLVWTFLKDMPARLLWRYLPIHLGMTAIYLGYYAARGQGKVFLRARLDAWRQVRRVWQKRRQVQAQRQVQDAEIDRMLSHHLLAPLRLGRWRRRRKA